jgi:PIN like domain
MSRPPDRPTFFVDRDLGPRFFNSLAADRRFGVEYHDAHFHDPATDDSVWLQLVAEQGWIAITHDRKIRAHHREIIAAYRARVIIIVGKRTMADHAANFLATYPRIERFVQHRSGPYTAKLYHPTPGDLKKLKPKGRIELWGTW